MCYPAVVFDFQSEVLTLFGDYEDILDSLDGIKRMYESQLNSKIPMPTNEDIIKNLEKEYFKGYMHIANIMFIVGDGK